MKQGERPLLLRIQTVQGPQKEYLGKLQYELKYDFNTQTLSVTIIQESWRSWRLKKLINNQMKVNLETQIMTMTFSVPLIGYGAACYGYGRRF